MPQEIDLNKIWKTGLTTRPRLLRPQNGVFIYLAQAKGENGRSENATGVDLSRQQAQIKATMEAIERSAFLNCRGTHLDLPFRKSRLKPNFNWMKYRWFSRDQLDKYPETKNLTFAKDVDWIQAQDVLTKKVTAVPGFCLSNARFPFFVEDSTNGWSAGPSQEFSIQSGTLELIERDAYLHHWLTKKSPQRLKIKKKDFGELQGLLAATGCAKDVKFLHFPSPSGAIVIGSYIQQPVEPFFLLGLGAGIDAKTALRKSLCELAALAHLKISKKDKNLLPEPISPTFNIITPTDHLLYYAAYDRQQDLAFLFAGKTSQFSEIKAVSWDKVISNLKRKGHRIFAIDATSNPMKELGIAVFKCFSPTLLGIDFKHRNQNLGSARLIGKKSLNSNPHPFA